MARVRLSLCAIALVASGGSVGRADVVTEWNDMLLAGIRTTTTWSPPQIAAAGAVVHTAVYDAVNSVMSRANPYKHYQPNAGADARAAAVEASYVTLTQLFGSGVGNNAFQTQLNNKRAASIAALPANAATSAGLTLGGTIGNQTLGWHNSTANLAPNASYTPGNTNPGTWQQDYPGAVVGLGMGMDYRAARPWTMTAPDQFRPAPFSPINSAQYTATFNASKELGAAVSATRTADQTKLAWFWGNDRNGTFKPPGHYNLWARTVADTQSGTFGADGTDDRLFNNARMLAMINVAQADAGIVAWDCKYLPNGETVWRPITAIRNGGTGGAGDLDGNPDTIGDPNWVPLSHASTIGLPAYTPGFPGYISGHSTFGAAVGEILKSLFGNNVTYTLATDDLDYIALNGGVATRTYTSIEQAILDNADSRLWLGVHLDQDNVQGVVAGRNVGQWVYANAFQIPAPSAGAVVLGAGLVGLRRRRR